MKKILSLCAIALPLLATPISPLAAANGFPPDNSMPREFSEPIYIAAGNCAAKANSLAASYPNAQILSVEENGASCVIVIRVNEGNGNPPRIIRRTVSG